MKYKLLAEINIEGRPFVMHKKGDDYAKIYKYHDENGTHFAIVYKDIATWAYDDSSLFSPDWGDSVCFKDKKEVDLDDYINKYYLNSDEVYTHDEGDGSSTRIRLSYEHVKVNIIKRYDGK